MCSLISRLTTAVMCVHNYCTNVYEHVLLRLSYTLHYSCLKAHGSVYTASTTTSGVAPAHTKCNTKYTIRVAFYNVHLHAMGKMQSRLIASLKVTIPSSVTAFNLEHACSVPPIPVPPLCMNHVTTSSTAILYVSLHRRSWDKHGMRAYVSTQLGTLHTNEP